MAGDRTSRKRQRTSDESPKEVDDDGKKGRGRPRVDGQDETAADRRRTQIRLAQRAYRQRKENTIATLRDQVTSLQATVEDMNKTFLAFNDKVVGSGVLQSNADLARILRNTTEHFINLAKAAGNSSSSDGSESEHEGVHTEAALSGMMALPEKVAPPPPVSGGVDIGLGYIQLFDEDTAAQLTPPHLPTDVNYAQAMQVDTIMNNAPTLDYNNPNGDFIMLPFTSGPESTLTTTSTYPLSLPSPPPMQLFNSSLKNNSIPAPYTFSLDEKTFARRLHRAALERAFHLLSTAGSRPAAIQRVFRLSLIYHSKEALMAKMKTILTKTTTDPLEFFHTPFIHLGGAGMHYAKGRVHNGYIIKPGPLPMRARLQHVESGIDPGFDIEGIDFERDYAGVWFDANDVEGFLEEQGLRINPQQTFAEAEVSSDSQIIKILEGASPEAVVPELEASTKSDSSGSPPTPDISNETAELGVARMFPELGGAEDFWMNNDSAAAGWLMGSGDKTPEFLASGWNEVQQPGVWDASDPYLADPQPLVQTRSVAKTRNITVDVGKMIDEMIRRGVCLGRAPGFRKEDVLHAVTSSVIQMV